MKVLFTGCTKTQSNDTGRMRNPYSSNPAGLHRAMVEAGHDVDWRPVVAGEDLTGYDCAVIGLGSMSSLGSKHLYGALWAVAQPIPKAFLIDDWKIDQIANFKSKNPERIFIKSLGGKWDAPNPRAKRAEGVRKKRAVLAAQKYLADSEWKELVLGSFYEQGDRELWLKGTNIRLDNLVAFDPTCFQPDYNVSPMTPESRDRVWILGSMADHSKWLKKLPLGWDVKVIGGKRTGFAVKAEDMLTEPELMRVYERSWGVMSPKYPHAGSGWWRARFLFSAQARCVLLASEEEVGIFGGNHTKNPYMFAAKFPQAVEAMSDSELQQLAEEQAGLLAMKTWGRDKMVAFGRDVVEEIVRRGVTWSATKEELDDVFIEDAPSQDEGRADAADEVFG